MSLLPCHLASEPNLFSENPLHLLFSPKSPFLLVEQLSLGVSGYNHLQARQQQCGLGTVNAALKLCVYVVAQGSCNTLN